MTLSFCEELLTARPILAKVQLFTPANRRGGDRSKIGCAGGMSTTDCSRLTFEGRVYEAIGNARSVAGRSQTQSSTFPLVGSSRRRYEPHPTISRCKSKHLSTPA